MAHKYLSRAAAATLFLIMITGCSDSFYLSESEVAAYSGNFRTELLANELFDNLDDQLIVFELDPASEIPSVQSSNIADVLRTTRLVLLEQFGRHIDLDRLGTQWEDELESWLRGSFQVVNNQGDSRANLRRIRRLQMRILDPPRLTYNAASQSVNFDLRVRVTISLTIDVNDPDGFLESLFVAPFVPDGRYPLDITADPISLQGSATLNQRLSDTTLLRVRATPTLGAVAVNGTAPNEVKSPIRHIMRQLLSQPIDESMYLGFEYYSIQQATLSSNPARLDLVYRREPATQNPVTHLVARGDDGRLYHSQNLDGESWSDYVAIDITAANGAMSDAALVASSPGKLELAAVDQSGEIHYAAWRDGRWQNFFGSRQVTAFNFLTAKPAVVASAPGQVELFALDSGSGIRHMRRKNGRWSPEQFIDYQPARHPLRDPVAVLSGNQVVLFFVDEHDDVFGKIYDLELESWGDTFSVGTKTTHAHSAASCGDGRIDLVYVKPDNSLYHTHFSVRPSAPDGLATMSGEIRVGGQFTGSPTLVCAGYQKLEVVVPGNRGRVFHNNLNVAQPARTHDGIQLSTGWQNWRELDNNFFGTYFASRVQPPIALAAASDGRVVAVARGRGTGSRSLVENTYDSSRYARAPWKAVQWRGFRRMANTAFVGTPALALWNRRIEVATVGADGRIRFAGLRRDFLLAPNGVSDGATQQPFDPLILSGGPGLLDVLFVDTNGKPRHSRRYSSATSPDQILSGTVISPMSAVAYGNGQIDAVAIGGDSALYHWRHRAGQWEHYTRIGGSVISLPVLVNTGAGQLELFAVGRDQRLYRWRFTGGQWNTPQQVESSFPINAVLFGPNSVTSRGDGSIDLLVTEANTFDMHYRHLRPPVPLAGIPGVALRPITFADPGFQNIGWRAGDIPTLTPVGSAFNVLSRTPDGNVYSSRGARPATRFTVAGSMPALQWSSPRLVGSDIAMIGGVMDAGNHELVAIGIDRNAILLINRMVGHRWTGFRKALPLPPELRRMPLHRPTLTTY